MAITLLYWVSILEIIIKYTEHSYGQIELQEAHHWEVINLYIIWEGLITGYFQNLTKLRQSITTKIMRIKPLPQI